MIHLAVAIALFTLVDPALGLIAVVLAAMFAPTRAAILAILRAIPPRGHHEPLVPATPDGRGGRGTIHEHLDAIG
jgi:hypothetical protein